jgi:polyribonucleotide nucleotidyltransferase
VNLVTKEFKYGNATVKLETGRIARQATGAVLVTMDDISVLVAVTAAKESVPGQDFFPLSVFYQERTYSVGKIPGGFIKRETRPSEKETLTSRLIDRPIRPLFPNGFMNEVQVVCQVMSANKTDDTDIAAMIGTSAALAISGIPFNGPIGAARVGFTDDNGYSLNPSYEALEDSLLNMVVAGTKDAVLMVESEAEELTEEEMLGAVMFAHENMQTVISAVTEFAEEVGTQKWQWQPAVKNEALAAAMEADFAGEIASAYSISEKMERYNALGELRAKAVEKLASSESEPNAEQVKKYFSNLEKKVVRDRIISNQPRIDGRNNSTVRPIRVETGIFPNTHGSALFTRGETQAIVTVTLGTSRDAQIVDALQGESKEAFMLNYNFPPYSVGECGRMGPPGRREIGHGKLAKRGLQALMPSEADFPYAVRVVSEITESNGSSSMATVCGGSLALMDAGVPLDAPVAGIAMGLVKEGEQFAVLTDILGDEDHLGDMDFKVAGTSEGITALQMDIKIEGINEEIMGIALKQANDARIHILAEMAKVIEAPRDSVSDKAPAMHAISVHPDKIRDVIGKGGAMIRSITEATGASIDIEDDGTIRVYAQDQKSAEAAISRIQAITAEAEVGKIYTGKVERLADFGAFVNILPGKDGLVHISQISDERVENVSDVLSEGQMVKVKVLDVDNRGRIKLTMKSVDQEDGE